MVAGYLLIFLPVYVLMTWGAVKFAHTATITNELNSTSWAPRIWPYKIIMALSFLLLVIQGLSTMLKNLQTLSNNPEK
jgi:TRAP-type mannitol/chloroaromatic compound transport system permease small subunit